MSDSLFDAAAVAETSTTCSNCGGRIVPARGMFGDHKHVETNAEICGPWPPEGGPVAAYEPVMPRAMPA